MATHKIGIDIGHGENTFQEKRSKGLIVDGKAYEEHHFNAQVGMKMKEIVEAHGVGVFMAQKPYAKDVPLRTRTDMYNAQDLDLIVSIHANAAKPEVRGLCAFYWPTSTTSKRAAEIYKKFVEVYNHNKYSGGMASWGDFHMIRETKAPAILTENGFMTNKDDFRLIFQSQAFVQEVAEINARTALEFLGVKYMSDDQPKPKEEVSKQVLTGGLSLKSLAIVEEFIKAKDWWAEVRFRKGVNPRLVTGGLDEKSLAEFEEWLKAKKWSYKVYDKGKVPN